MSEPEREVKKPLGLDLSKITPEVVAKAVERAIAEDEALPKKFSRGTGIFYDPKWQDDPAAP